MCVIERSPVIETRRLKLRAPERRDAGVMARLGNDFDVVRMTARMPWPYTARDADDFVSRCEQRDWDEDATFAIELEDEGFAGVLGCTQNESIRFKAIGQLKAVVKNGHEATRKQRKGSRRPAPLILS